MRTIIAGSRDINIQTFLDGIYKCPWLDDITVIISGTARGVDTFGEEYAKCQGIPVMRFPAQWDKYGKSAGFKRNMEMAEHADALIAIWDGVSKGTENMIQHAKNNNLRLFVYNLMGAA